MKKIKADSSWSGASGGGMYGPVQDGLGIGGPGLSGVPNSINLPPGHQGHSGSGTWSGDVITDETFNSEVGLKKIKEFSAEELINKIKALIKINTSDSMAYARMLMNVLDSRMHALKACRRQYQLTKIAQTITRVAELKQDPFVIALFNEHDVPLADLDFVELPDEINHYALHDLVHRLQKMADVPEELPFRAKNIPRQKFEEDLPDEVYRLYSWGWQYAMDDDPCRAADVYRQLARQFPEWKEHDAVLGLKVKIEEELKYLGRQVRQAQTAQPIKGKCPESDKVMYMSQTDLVQNDYKADCPEGKRRLKNQKSVSIKEYTKRKKKKKKKSKTKKKAQTQTTTYDTETERLMRQLKAELDALESKIPTLQWGAIESHQVSAESLYRKLLESIGYESPTDEVKMLQDRFLKLYNEASQQQYDYHIAVEQLHTMGGRPNDIKKFLEEQRDKHGEQWVNRLLMTAHLNLPEITKETTDEQLEWFSTETLARPLAAQDFYNFYGASLLLPFLNATKLPEGWIRPVRETVITTINRMAEKLLRAAKDAGAKELKHILDSGFTFRPNAEQRYQSLLNKIQGIEKRYNSLDEFNRLRSERKLAFSQMADLFGGEWVEAFGGEAWQRIMLEAEKLQSMMPATMENLGPIVAQIDHFIDLEHNTGLFLDTYVENIEGYDRLEDFLSEKTEKWDLETFKKNAPQFYNMYMNLQRYAKILRGLNKRAFTTTLTFTPREQVIIDRVKEAADALNINCYLVGGAVRDRLLGKDNVDLDFMCERDAAKLVMYLADKYGTDDPIEYGRSKAIMISMGGETLDFIDAKMLFRPLRRDESLEGEEEFTVSFDDAYRRDLTINTLMYDIRSGKLLDPTGRGLKDLQNKVLNTIIDPYIKYKIHAPDMLRALRFAATKGFTLGPRMLDAMRAHAERVRPRDVGGDISNRRIRRELRKTIDDPAHWAKMLELLKDTGLDVVIADDIQDVQEDFVGGIKYHFDENKKESNMRIKNFTKQAQPADPMEETQVITRDPHNLHRMMEVAEAAKAGDWDKARELFHKLPKQMRDSGARALPPDVVKKLYEGALPEKPDMSKRVKSNLGKFAVELARVLGANVTYETKNNREVYGVWKYNPEERTKLALFLEFYEIDPKTIEFVRRTKDNTIDKKELVDNIVNVGKAYGYTNFESTKAHQTQASPLNLLTKKKKNVGIGPVKPVEGEGRNKYLAKQLDALLKKTPRNKHDAVVEQFLRQYRQITPDDQLAIKTMLNYYNPENKSKTPRKDIWID